MKYSLSELLDCLVDNGHYDYYFNFTPDMVIDIRHNHDRYIDQIFRTLNIGVSPEQVHQLRLLAFEITIL